MHCRNCIGCSRKQSVESKGFVGQNRRFICNVLQNYDSNNEKWVKCISLELTLRQLKMRAVTSMCNLWKSLKLRVATDEAWFISSLRRRRIRQVNDAALERNRVRWQCGVGLVVLAKGYRKHSLLWNSRRKRNNEYSSLSRAKESWNVCTDCWQSKTHGLVALRQRQTSPSCLYYFYVDLARILVSAHLFSRSKFVLLRRLSMPCKRTLVGKHIPLQHIELSHQGWGVLYQILRNDEKLGFPPMPLPGEAFLAVAFNISRLYNNFAQVKVPIITSTSNRLEGKHFI